MLKAKTGDQGSSYKSDMSFAATKGALPGATPVVSFSYAASDSTSRRIPTDTNEKAIRLLGRFIERITAAQTEGKTITVCNLTLNSPNYSGVITTLVGAQGVLGQLQKIVADIPAQGPTAQ